MTKVLADETLKAMKHKICAVCGFDEEVKQLDNQTYEYWNKEKAWIPLYEVRYVYYCPRCDQDTNV